MILNFKHKKRLIKRIEELYLQIDVNDSDSISLNEFFELIDIIEANAKWQLPLFGDSI